jgi:hypothetical protein
LLFRTAGLQQEGVTLPKSVKNKGSSALCEKLAVA